ncbi:MAG: 3-oxoacyl-ACP reductase family protein [Hyphomicrobiales bacterium]|nr:3-oxoacyl-ACP reductase family protein [Hyphomicrobiales bacterium]
MSHHQELQGKVALVTGGSRGIGAAIAKKLASEGAKVALSYSASPDAAHAVVAEIKSNGGDAVAFQANAADSAQVAKLVNDAAAHFGRLDILVNNAGVFELLPVTEVTDEVYNKSFDINVRAVFAGVREAAKHLGDGGRIITIGSVNGQRVPFNGGALYAATKFAVQGFTRGWAREFGPKGITVNVVQPGPIDTDMNPASGDFAPMLIPGLAIPRYGKTHEVADLVAFLAGPNSTYITGAAINVDGGMEA